MSERSRLRRQFINTGGFRRRGGEFIVFNELSGMADAETLIISDSRQPKHSYLAQICDRMSEATLTRHLAHLEKHNWVNRIRGGGLGNPTRYEVSFGHPCDCRPEPLSNAERQCRHRERKRQAAL